MALKTTIICVLVLAVTVVSCVRLRTVSSTFVCKRSNRQIHIYRSQGLVVQQRIRKHLQSMNLEVYINKKYQPNPSCDICVNVTVINERKKWLTVKVPSVVVLPRDTVQYSITKHYRFGPPKRFTCELHVGGERMKFVPKQSCNGYRPKTTQPSEKRNYATEKALLEEMINDLLSSCEVMDESKLLVLAENHETIESEGKALKRYVVQRLKSLLPSVNWHETIENVSGSQNRIVFEVRTVLMKLKILHSIRGTDVAKIITDFEEFGRSAKDYDDYYDDDYEDYEEIL